MVDQTSAAAIARSPARRPGTTTYLRQDADGDPVSQRTGSGAYHYLFDGLGNVVGLTDGSGSVVATYGYDPCGNVTSHAGSVDSLVTWNSSIYDSSAGLYKFGDCFYDPLAWQLHSDGPCRP